MSKHVFHCGDVVKGYPHYADIPEMGVILERSPSGNYSINWQQSASQAWFEPEGLELVQRCLIQVRRSDTY
jgi:hypothetical protein